MIRSAITTHADDLVPDELWAMRRRGITARIARRGIESSTRLGRHR